MMRLRIVLIPLMILMIIPAALADFDPFDQRSSFNDFEWNEVRPSNPMDPMHWEPRAGLQAVAHHDHLFVIGGRTPSSPFIPFASTIHADVWVSGDQGVTWTELVEDAEAAGMWPRRAYFEALTHGGHIYLLGGQNFVQVDNDCTFWPPELGPCPPQISVSAFYNDVWRSGNGADWEMMTAAAPWAGRAGLGAASFRGRLWVMGGSQNDDEDIAGMGRIFFNDVWFSTDGANWQRATANAPWEPRAGGVVLVKGDWLYVMGGEKGFINPEDYFNDVWRTRDGQRWFKVTDNAGWSPRPGHKCSVVEDHFVCMGGYGFPFNPSDVWVSRNGTDWTQVSASPWDNDPDQPIYVPPPGYPGCSSSPPLRCDNVRYDFDMVTVDRYFGRDAESVPPECRYYGHREVILTFGGDRERFELDAAQNFVRVDNDVWRYAFPEPFDCPP